LDIAERLIQTRGFNGFSYIDLANEIGIKTASIHYYFKTKDDLAAALVERIHKAHAEGFSNIQASTSSPRKRLQAVIAFFQQYAADGKFCLCGMMAAELRSVSSHVSSLLNKYFKDFQTWLARQFKDAGASDAQRQALSFLSALEGSLLLARLRGDPKIVHEALKSFCKA